MPSTITIGGDDVLLAIDLQLDFMPGGALAVDDGDTIVPLINALMRRFGNVVVTQDWHPPQHASFSSRHPGTAPFDTKQLDYGEQTLWPDHCVQGTRRPRCIPRWRPMWRFSFCARACMPASIPTRPSSRPTERRRPGWRRCSRRVASSGSSPAAWRPIIASPFRRSMRARRASRLRHRRRLPGDRCEQFAGGRLGADERRRGVAHPVARVGWLSRAAFPRGFRGDSRRLTLS